MRETTGQQQTILPPHHRHTVRGVRALAAAGTLLLMPLGQAMAERTPLSTPLPKAGFEQIAQRAGVTVYKHPKTDIIRLGAEGRFEAPTRAVLRALLDYENQPGRIGRVSESKVVYMGKRELGVYQRLNLPVISDRDFTIRVRWGKSGDTRWISYQTANKLGPPPRSGIVRVQTHEGSWQLKPAAGGKATDARFQVIIDLAGWLPKWLARSNSGKEIPELFLAVRRMLPKQSPTP